MSALTTETALSIHVERLFQWNYYIDPRGIYTKKGNMYRNEFVYIVGDWCNESKKKISFYQLKTFCQSHEPLNVLRFKNDQMKLSLETKMAQLLHWNRK